jgi:hypothetical protein
MTELDASPAPLAHAELDAIPDASGNGDEPPRLVLRPDDSRP